MPVTNRARECEDVWSAGGLLRGAHLCVPGIVAVPKSGSAGQPRGARRLLAIIFLWTGNPDRSNFKPMKTKYFLGFALFITMTVLVSGCKKANTNLDSENANLKARVQKLEQQLKESKTHMAAPAPQASQSTTNLDLSNQLDEAQKKAEAAVNDLASITSQFETQKTKIDDLTRELANALQAKEKAEKALLLYQDKAATAVKEFKTLRSTLVVTNIPGGTNTLSSTNALRGTNALFEGYHQKYLAMQKTVTNAVGVLPESRVRREILGVLAMFTRLNETWETAALQMQERTREAQADYDKFVSIDGIGANDYVIKMGKDKILAPAAEENADTASRRDTIMVSLARDIDPAIKKLQDLVGGQKI
jgi:hypothetical protein